MFHIVSSTIRPTQHIRKKEVISLFNIQFIVRTLHLSMDGDLQLKWPRVLQAMKNAERRRNKKIEPSTRFQASFPALRYAGVATVSSLDHFSSPFYT